MQHPKILIVRFSSIGDIVLTTPVVRAIKRQLPGAEVHYLTKKPYGPVLKGNPYIDKIFFLKKSLGDTLEELKKENYYAIIDLHNNQRTFVLKTILNVKSYSFPKLNFEKWLMVNFKINKLPALHIVDRYMEAAAPLGVVNDGEGLDYFIPAGEEIALDQLPAHFKKGYIAFAIGALHFTKRYPVEKVIEVCRQSFYPVVLLGGRDDMERGEQIASVVNIVEGNPPGTGNTKVFNACGKFSLNGSASLIKQALKVVTNDTGLMHIAAALHKPIISLWGNTIPDFGMSPYYGDKDNITQAHILEAGELDCRPCSKIGFDRCPRGHFKCMNQIEEKTVCDLINETVEADLSIK